jgi:hypothetical protein
VGSILATILPAAAVIAVFNTLYRADPEPAGSGRFRSA